MIGLWNRSDSLIRNFTKPNSISSYLKCPICTDVYHQPLRLFCSHTLCTQCLLSCSKSKSVCPICREPIDGNKVGIDQIAMSVIDELEVYCVNQDCSWRGQLNLLRLHVEHQCIVKIANTKVKKASRSEIVPSVDLEEDLAQKINENTNKGSLYIRVIQNSEQQSKQGWRDEALKMFQKTLGEQISEQKKSAKKKGHMEFLESLWDHQKDKEPHD